MMALLPILHFPDERLRRQAQPVPDVNDEIRRLMDDMLETMYDAPGVGLAAPQVDVVKRVIVVDVSEERDAPLAMVNPEVIAREGVEVMEEGCLSVPGIYENVERAASVRIRYLDRSGQADEVDAEGLLAVCLQHEIDHLDGKLFVDYLTEIKRQRIKKKLEKARRHNL